MPDIIKLPCAECGARSEQLFKKTGTGSHKKVCASCFVKWTERAKAYARHVKREERVNNCRLVSIGEAWPV